MNEAHAQDLVSLSAAAVEFKVTYMSLYGQLGRLDARRIAGGWYVSRAGVRKWLKSRRGPGRPPRKAEKKSQKGGTP